MPDSTGYDKFTEIYRRFLLPAMGIAETIGTKGASPGTVAMRNMAIFDQAEREKREQEAAAKRAAMEEQLFGMKKTAYDEEATQRRQSKYKMEAFADKLRSAQSDPEKEAIAKAYFQENYPEEYGKILLKPKDQMDLMDLLRMQFLQGQINNQNQPKLNAAQEAAITSVGEAKNLLTDLANEFNSVSTGRASQAFSSALSQIPVVGPRINPKEAAYNAKRRLVAETYLRAATGAAAPDKEVTTYMNFLPSLGDPTELASKKMESFIHRIEGRAEGVANALDAVGRPEQAEMIRQNTAKEIAVIRQIKFGQGDASSGAIDPTQFIVK